MDLGLTGRKALLGRGGTTGLGWLLSYSISGLGGKIGLEEETSSKSEEYVTPGTDVLSEDNPPKLKHFKDFEVDIEASLMNTGRAV